MVEGVHDVVMPALVRRWHSDGKEQVAFAVVYRNRWAPSLRRLVDDIVALGGVATTWALDEVHPALEPFTAGVGRGLRTTLLNRAIAAADIPPEAYLFVGDDDIAMTRTDLLRMVQVMRAAGFGIAQPSQRWTSYRSFEMTRRQAFSVARRTAFIEAGPLVVISPEWRDRLVPLPEEYGMGWGLELVWKKMEGSGCLQGVVDAAAFRHLAPVGGGYPVKSEVDRLAEMCAAIGVRSLRELQATEEVWRPWQAAPPWLVAAD
jgi:hypothetical protein